MYRDFPPPPAPVYGPLSSGPSLASLPPPPPVVQPAVSLDPLPPPPLPAQAAVGPDAFYPPSEAEERAPSAAPELRPVHRFIPDSVKNFFRGSGRSSKRSLPKSERSAKNGHSSVGVPCSPPHSAPPSPSLPGSYRDPYGGSYRSAASQKDALLLGAEALDSVSAVPTSASAAQTYAERVEQYHLRYAYMKSWPGLLRILGVAQLLLGAAVFACVCAYVHKDNEWFNMYGYSTPQLYGGLGGAAYPGGGTPYTGPKTPFVLVVAGLAWVVTVVLVVLGMSLYYRTILLDSSWWPLTEAAINVALAVLYFAAGAVYVRDTTRGGMCNLPVFNNGLNGAFCRVEAGQTAAIVFIFINATLYLVSAAVCLKLWRHEAARLRRQAYELEMKTIGSSAPLSILGGGSHISNPTPLPTLSAAPDLTDGHAPSPALLQPEILRGHIPAGHIPKPVVIADYVAKYPSIRSDEEREKYRAVFNDQYAEYKELHAEVQAAAQRFDDMDHVIQGLQATAGANHMEQERINGILQEYQRKKNDPTFVEKRERCEYLKNKLSHIKQKISEYNQATLQD